LANIFDIEMFSANETIAMLMESTITSLNNSKGGKDGVGILFIVIESFK
jgi:hypothetical protein